MAETTVTASGSDAGAVVEIAPVDADDGTDGHQVELVVGAMVTSVVVTAQDGVTTRTYSVTVKPGGGTRQED